MSDELEPVDREELGMTEEQWELFQRLTRGYGEQDEQGVDLSLLRENLRLTPTERIEKMRRALDLAMELRRAGIASGIRDTPTRACDE